MDIDSYLEKHNLRKTRGRVEVLKIFSKSEHALSQPDLENKIKSVDRTTLYRILYDFVNSGILHPVLSGSGKIFYSLCREESCKRGKHEDNHVHFECKKCGNIFCFNDIKIPRLKIKKSFVTDSVDYKISGTCKKCNKGKK